MKNVVFPRLREAIIHDAHGINALCVAGKKLGYLEHIHNNILNP